MTRIAGGTAMVAAFMTGFTGLMLVLQITSGQMMIWTTWMKPAPWLMLAGGVLVLPFAGGIIKARDWAAVLGLGGVGFLTLLNLVWNVWALMNRGFVAWAFLALLACSVAMLFVPLAVKDCFVASKNRRKLLQVD